MSISLIQSISDRLRCGRCARRREMPVLKAFRGGGLRPGHSSGPSGPQFRDLSDEVHASVLLCLRGLEAPRLAAASKTLSQLVGGNGSEGLWRELCLQEFHGVARSDAVAQSLPLAVYRSLIARERCQSFEWRRVPCTHRLGTREGSPTVFECRGHLFVFGGWGHGPMSDLHGGKIEAPLVLRSLPMGGEDRPRATYEAKVTVLEYSAGIGTQDSPGPVKVIVTGGYLMGGYHGESDQYGVFQIEFSEDGPQARWLRSGAMPARSNHTATFVPPRIAGDMYPEGYLFVFGGNMMGRATNNIDVLDLKTFTWERSVNASGDAPDPRNSHSATLVRTQAHGDAILVAGGGDGADRNGGPPRGGGDLGDAFWMTNLRGAMSFEWVSSTIATAPPAVPGRGHVGCRLAGTDCVVAVGGGRPPQGQIACFVKGEPHTVERPGAIGPSPRAFGGGCCLADGTVVLYGGWHPRGGTFGDIWAGRITGDTLGREDFFAKLPEQSEETQQSHEEDDSSEDGEDAMPLALGRLFGGGGGRAQSDLLRRIMAELHAERDGNEGGGMGDFPEAPGEEDGSDEDGDDDEEGGEEELLGLQEASDDDDDEDSGDDGDADHVEVVGGVQEAGDDVEDGGVEQ